jgi:hypothetical protein
MRLKIHGNNTDRSSRILCSKKHARRKVSVPLQCNATGSKSLALFPLLASSKTSSEAQSSRNSMTKKRVESQFIAFIQPYLRRIPTTTTKTNGVMRHTDAFEVDSSMHPRRKPSEIKPHYQAARYRHWISNTPGERESQFADNGAVASAR